MLAIQKLIALDPELSGLTVKETLVTPSKSFMHSCIPGFGSRIRSGMRPLLGGVLSYDNVMFFCTSCNSTEPLPLLHGPDPAEGAFPRLMIRSGTSTDEMPSGRVSETTHKLKRWSGAKFVYRMDSFMTSDRVRSGLSSIGKLSSIPVVY